MNTNKLVVKPLSPHKILVILEKEIEGLPLDGMYGLSDADYVHPLLAVILKTNFVLHITVLPMRHIEVVLQHDYERFFDINIDDANEQVKKVLDEYQRGLQAA